MAESRGRLLLLFACQRTYTSLTIGVWSSAKRFETQCNLATHLNVSLLLLIIPCPCFDRLRKLKHIQSTFGPFAPGFRFDDCSGTEDISTRDKHLLCSNSSPSASSGSSFRFRFIRRIVYDTRASVGCMSSIVKTPLDRALKSNSNVQGCGLQTGAYGDSSLGNAGMRAETHLPFRCTGAVTQ